MNPVKTSQNSTNRDPKYPKPYEQSLEDWRDGAPFEVIPSKLIFSSAAGGSSHCGNSGEGNLRCGNFGQGTWGRSKVKSGAMRISFTSSKDFPSKGEGRVER